MDVWDAILKSLRETDLGELSDLPQRISDNINSVFDRLTLEGALPTVILSRHTIAPSSHSVNVPPPPRSLVQRCSDSLTKKPLLSLSILAAVIGSCSYLYARPPALLLPYHPRRKSLLRKEDRPRKSADGNSRLEAVLILGADYGSLGYELALDAEDQGYIVIAAVSNSEEAAKLEKEGNGYIRALVLDTSETTSIQTFTRNLSTSLSLRYPLNSAGDPYQASALSLTSVVNLFAYNAISAPAVPLEAMSSNSIAQLTATIYTSLQLSASLLPLLRNASRKFENSQPVYITVTPSTSNINLPFRGHANILSVALRSFSECLRREIELSDITLPADCRQSVRFMEMDVGFIDINNHYREEQRIPYNLRNLYAPALALYNPRVATRGYGTRRRRTAVETVTSKILKAMTGESMSNRKLVGAGSKSYYLASLLPTRLIDGYLALTTSLSATMSRPEVDTTPRAHSRGRPLPNLPASQRSSSLPSPQSSKAPSQSNSETEDDTTDLLSVKSAASSVDESDKTMGESKVGQLGESFVSVREESGNEDEKTPVVA